MVGHVVLSTDGDDIAAVAEECGLPVSFRRPPELASTTAAKIDAIRHATEYVEEHENFFPTIIVDLDIGVPLRTPEDITACVERLEEHKDLDAVVTVYEAERNPYFNMVELEGHFARLVKQSPVGFVRGQDAPPVYGVSPSVFAWRRERLSVVHLYEGCWGAHIVPRLRAIDIDQEIDFQFVEFLLTHQKNGCRP